MIEGDIYTDGEIKRDYAQYLEAQIALLPPNTEKIIHHIRSGGGNVYGGYEGYLALRKLAKPIKTIIEGACASMATFVALAGDEVEIMTPGGFFLIHNPFFGDGVKGDADEMGKAQTELRQIEDTMAEAYQRKTKLPLETVKAMMKKETRMTPRQAKEMGFVDLVVDQSVMARILEEVKQDLKEFKQEVMALWGKNKKETAMANVATAVDLPLKAGGNIHIESDNGDFVGKPASIDGKPAEGSYPLGDGRTLVCVAGKVTEVTAALPMPPQETDAQKVARLSAELAAFKAAEAQKLQAAQESEKAKQLQAEVDKAKTAATEKEKELVAAQAKIKELETKTVGDDKPPAQAMVAQKYGVRQPNASDLDATKLFLWTAGFQWLTDRPESGMYGYRPSDPNAASVLETNFSYTWPGILTDEIFYKPQLTGFALADFFTIDQGIKDRKRYNLVTQLDKILKPYGGCARVFSGTVDIMDTIVQTKEFQVGLEWCKDDFTNQLSGSYNILASDWLKTGNRSFDPSGTPIATVIDKLASEALARDVMRRVFFADAGSTDEDYNQIDGFFARSIDSAGQSGYCVIDANGTVYGGTRMGLDALAANEAQTNLEAVYFRSAQILKNMASKKFYVTRSVWENWFTTLTGVGAVTEQQFKNLVDGVPALTYKGIPVIPVDLWDSFLTEADNPLFGTTRHLIVLTVKENHILGVENSADLNKLEGWYERKDRKFYIEGDMKFGYNYLHCDLTTIAR